MENQNVQVRKGIEAKCIIHGLEHNDFWTVAFSTVGAAFLVAFLLYCFAKHPSLESFFTFLAALGGAATAILYSYFQYKKRAKKDKHNFKKSVSGISCQDLYDYLPTKQKTPIVSGSKVPVFFYHEILSHEN
jgi:hypothetical protein